MSAAAIHAAIAARLDTIAGLYVMAANPSSIHNPPLAFVLLEGDTPVRMAGNPPVVHHNWRWAVQVCVDVQDPVKAEDQLTPFADSVPAALQSDVVITSKAHISTPIEQSAVGADGYPIVAEKQYRAITFRFTTKETP